MYTVTRRNPNGVPVASPSATRHRTFVGAALRALGWMRSGYAVDMERAPTSLVAQIRQRPAVQLPPGRIPTA